MRNKNYLEFKMRFKSLRHNLEIMYAFEDEFTINAIKTSVINFAIFVMKFSINKF